MQDLTLMNNLPKSIKDLAEENQKVKKSPVGLLFDIHKKNA